MAWQKLIIQTVPAQAETLANALLEVGALAVSLEENSPEAVFQLEPEQHPLWQQLNVVALLDTTTDAKLLLAQCQALLNCNELPKYKIETLADQDWVRKTQQDFKAQCFADKLWICPTHCDANNLIGDVVRIDPGLAFGTGTHATTAMCLKWLAEHPPKDLTVIDYGCGSGILALSALSLGAKKVTAVDHDKQALIATENNFKLNHFTGELTVGLPNTITEPANVVLANILANPLIELAPRLTTLVESGGYLILSGLLNTEKDRVFNAYQEQFTLLDCIQEQEWSCLILLAKSSDTILKAF